MNKKLKILFVLIVVLGSFSGRAQTSSEKLSLFTDRDYCISGDTLWFNIYVSETLKEKGNIIRVQLENRNGDLIGNVLKKSNNGWSRGYLHIPDSLSTGVCFVSAFVNAQRQNPDFKVQSKTLFVYNRFDENVFELDVPDQANKKEVRSLDTQIHINTNKTLFKARENVKVQINSETELISNSIVKATLMDPLSNEVGGSFEFSTDSSRSNIPAFTEKDGFLLSGKVYDQNEQAQKGVLVILSIPGENPYFDYYVSGENGDFNFFLKNAVGKVDVVLQPISNTGKEYQISTRVNRVFRNQKVAWEKKTLKIGQSDFISSFINANYFYKIFNPVLSTEEVGFDMPERFSIPYYGPPSNRIIPDEFIDLPNFQEISREILQGVQYRVKNKEIIFRVLNETQSIFFDSEPLRLINGIPVFKNSLFASLKSTDIKYIDIVQKERLFGDLMFKGILAVTLHDNSNSWMTQLPNNFRFRINCLQPDITPGYVKNIKNSNNLPDSRQIYLWEMIEPKKSSEYNFQLSDLKGWVEISVEGVTRNNEVFKSSKVIEVK